MIERQDIDALLVSALYGELTPADEARLTTHLESHPGDRTALDDLKIARQAIRESRIFELQLDPPQAVSALLLQEAARRAPRRIVVDDSAKRESWFARFVRSFVAHPAMAAAATLVLVVGVAGTLYMRKGSDQFAEQTAQQVAAPQAGEGAPQRALESSSAGSAGSPAQGSTAGDNGVTVALDEKADKFKYDETRKVDKANEVGNNDGKIGGARPVTPAPPKHVSKPTTTPEKEKVAVTKKGTSGGYLEMHSPDPTPKELDAPRSNAEGSKTPAETTSGRYDGIASGNAAPGGGTTSHAGSAPAMGPTTGTSAQQPAPPPALATVDKSPTAAKPDPKAKEDPTVTWARDQHQRLLGLVKAGKCQDAAPVAVQIKNRAPDYYGAYVANDRGLKQCLTYITDAAERDAERNQKSRPAKRIEADSVK